MSGEQHTVGQPWPVSSIGNMWTYKGHGLFRQSIRNDALWVERAAEREAIRSLCTQWREAAEADGWTFEPTYGDHEPMEQAFRGRREGFVIQGLNRPITDKSLSIAQIHIWGPDDLAIVPPPIYDMVAIRLGARACGYCDATDVDTKRVGFAGRVCAECDPKVRPSIEYGNWAE